MSKSKVQGKGLEQSKTNPLAGKKSYQGQIKINPSVYGQLMWQIQGHSSMNVFDTQPMENHFYEFYREESALL